MKLLPDLHTAKEPEWKDVLPSERNYWQRWAARTNGLLTPGDLVTSSGNASVALGIGMISSGRDKLGLAAIAAGRLADVFDGIIAHATHTKSPLGEAYDAISDKVQIAVVLPIFVAEHIAPVLPVGIIGAEQMAVAMYSAVAKGRGNEIQARREGKLHTYFAWLSIIGFGASNLVSGNAHESLETASWSSAAISIGLGLAAIQGYRHDSLPQTDEIIDQPQSF